MPQSALEPLGFHEPLTRRLQKLELEEIPNGLLLDVGALPHCGKEMLDVAALPHCGKEMSKPLVPGV